MKKLLSLFLIVPMLMYCAPGNESPQEETPQEQPSDDNPEDTVPEKPTDPYKGASPEFHSGDVLQATNPNVEKFLTEVTYPDKDLSFTKVLDYYGGFNGKTYNENGEEDPAGKIFDWDNQPTSDKPCSYSLRWAWEDLEDGNPLTLHMEDGLGWKGDLEIAAYSCYVNVTNLIPNDQYTYKVTTSGGKVLAEGNFTTKGNSTLHHLFFTSACRNIRDLGGWSTLDGKKVKYRKLYRGGRLQLGELKKGAGQNEVLFEGIGAQLDLRNSDRLKKTAVKGLEFCAPGIEEGGTWMLKNGNENGNFGKQCFEFTVNCLRAGKPVYFHCSLGRDRTGTFDILCLGLLGVREGDISKAYEVTYFAPVGYSVSSSEKKDNPTPIFLNTRMQWAYADVAPYFWSLSEDGTFANGVEHYLLDVAGVSQKDIDDFRSIMLE